MSRRHEMRPGPLALGVLCPSKVPAGLSLRQGFVTGRNFVGAVARGVDEVGTHTYSYLDPLQTAGRRNTATSCSLMRTVDTASGCQHSARRVRERRTSLQHSGYLRCRPCWRMNFKGQSYSAVPWLLRHACGLIYILSISAILGRICQNFSGT